MLHPNAISETMNTFSEVKKHLLIDEVYTANCVEYQYETFFGWTEDGACAKTVLTFMVQLICRN